MAVLVVCGVDENGRRDIIAVEQMAEESEDSCRTLFKNLKERGMVTPKLLISDAHDGLTAAIRMFFLGASRKRCKVHFMRNILVHIPHRDKKVFAAALKEIWLAPSAETARKRANDLIKTYEKRFPKAVTCLENGLEDSLSFYSFPNLDNRKISSSNMIERLNKGILRCTSVVGVFPNEDFYIRLVTTYLMEYAEDWSVSGQCWLEVAIKVFQLFSVWKPGHFHVDILIFSLTLGLLCSQQTIPATGHRTDPLDP